MNQLDPASYASWQRIAKSYGLTDQESDSVIAEALRLHRFNGYFKTLCQRKKAERR